MSHLPLAQCTHTHTHTFTHSHTITHTHTHHHTHTHTHTITRTHNSNVVKYRYGNAIVVFTSLHFILNLRQARFTHLYTYQLLPPHSKTCTLNSDSVTGAWFIGYNYETVRYFSFTMVLKMWELLITMSWEMQFSLTIEKRYVWNTFSNSLDQSCTVTY